MPPSPPSQPSLPYIEGILEARERGGGALGHLFERFMHWGYWQEPAQATGEGAELVEAMQRMNVEVLGAATLTGGQAVLDVGCGFGGTLATAMDLYRGLRLVGLSNDARQLELARQGLSPKNGCSFELVEADACAMPFADDAFQRIIALESIFHFPSRVAFLKEACRVLEPGGVLVLTDFVPEQTAARGPRAALVAQQLSQGYGGHGKGWSEGTYPEMASASGLEPTFDRDLTDHTLPTYPVVLDAFREHEAAGGQAGMVAGTELLERLSRFGFLRYRLLGFVKAR